MKATLGVRKGAWIQEEDELLRACIHKYGEGKWQLVPQRAGLNRCRKSCRIRWLNYLKPGIKRGDFAEDEIDMMIRLHRLLGNRWSLIAGRLPGRTPNDVKNYWNTYIRKRPSHYKELDEKREPKEAMKTHRVIKPKPRTFSKNLPWLREKSASKGDSGAKQCISTQACAVSREIKTGSEWWRSLLDQDKGSKEGNSPCSFSEQDGNLLRDLLDEEFTTTTTKERELLTEDDSWSDFLVDINMWDPLF